MKGGGLVVSINETSTNEALLKCVKDIVPQVNNQFYPSKFQLWDIREIKAVINSCHFRVYS